MTGSHRRIPQPWSVDEHTESFCIKDAEPAHWLSGYEISAIPAAPESAALVPRQNSVS